MEVGKAICILFGAQPRFPGRSVRRQASLEDYWALFQKDFLSDCGLIRRLHDYDKDSMSDDMVACLDHFMTDEELTPESVRRASHAASVLCRWVHAMHIYHRISKKVWPKRAELQALENRMSIILRRLSTQRRLVTL